MGKDAKEIMFRDTILEVPYSSQYLDIEKKEHLLTACGMASVYMALRYYGVNGESLDKLVEKGIDEGGYSKSGWLHDYLVQVFQSHGVKCHREEHLLDRDIEKIKNSVKNGDPVVISMQWFSFHRRIFHMVLVTGYRENEEGGLEGFFYHDPAGLNPAEVTNLFVPASVFLQYWRRMAIFPKRNG